MSKILVTRGLPASGKTTFAQAWVAEDPDNRLQVSRDDLRHAFYKTYGKLSRPQENMVTVAETGVIEAALERDKAVVIDAMHLRPRYVRRWEKLARQKGVEFEVKEFEISIEESVRRNHVRRVREERFVRAGVVQDMCKWLTKDEKLMPYEPLPEPPVVEVEKYVADINNPPAIVVDIDGTVALHNGRNPYDLSRVGEDLPNWPVIYLIAMLQDHYLADQGQRLEVIFLSGREATCDKETREWIETNALRMNRSYELYMRPAGDGRKDSIVKRELFDAHVRNRFNVKYVLDDRNSVVEMWRSLGLTCLQVADGNF